MSILLDGTNGGTTSAGWYAQSAWSGTYADGIVVDYVTGNGRITVGSADGLTIYNGGTSSRSALVTLDSSGNLGLGVTPSGWGYAGQNVLQVKNAGFAGFSNTAYVFANTYLDSSGTLRYIANGYATYNQQSSGAHYWFTSASGTAGNAISFTQAMTLDASGNLLVGTTTAYAKLVAQSASDSQFLINSSNTSSAYSTISLANQGTIKSQIYWYQGNTNLYVNNGSGGVYMATNGTAWNANSDERLKDIIEPITNAVSKVSALRAVIGKYKTDEEGTRKPFLIAQDVEAVLPEAVTRSKLSRSEDETEYLGIAYTDTIPLLVAAIKELTQRLEKLENKNG